ncbi:MAG: HDOD domain-containing protein [Pseudomonadota bacterium]
MPVNPQVPIVLADPRETAQTRARLIHKFSSDGDLLSLGVAIARVVELTSSEDEAARNITYYVLADAALTQKILRLANTVHYRTSSTPVTTISRAIFLLGLESVKTAALALLLVDSLSNMRHAEAIRKELVESLCASLIGRELARNSQIAGAEESSIAALFNNLGRMLMASHEPLLYLQINERAGIVPNPVQAAIQVMGCSYEFLTETVLRSWNFPESMVAALEKIPPGALKPTKVRAEWMRQVVSFSGDCARLVLHKDDPVTSAQAQALLARYGAALQIDAERLKHLFASVGRELEQVMTSLHLMPPSADAAPGAVAKPESTLPSVLKLSSMNLHTINTTERHESGKPLNARDLLLDGIQVATQMMGTGTYKPSALILLVVETLYSALGFRFATVVVKDQRSSMFRAIVSIGEDHLARQARFAFPAAPEADIFHLAMENNADLMIEDASSGKIRDLLPAWHKALLPDTRSIMLLPLVQGKTQCGVFYGDRTRPATEGISSDETALIKTLIGQMMTAIDVR